MLQPAEGWGSVCRLGLVLRLKREEVTKMKEIGARNSLQTYEGQVSAVSTPILIIESSSLINKIDKRLHCLHLRISTKFKLRSRISNVSPAVGWGSGWRLGLDVEPEADAASGVFLSARALTISVAVVSNYLQNENMFQS